LDSQQTNRDDWDGHDKQLCDAARRGDGWSHSYCSIAKIFWTETSRNHANTISATITMLAENVTWSIIGAYGPQTDPEKRNFLQEIRSLKQSMKLEWLIRGHFNLICRAQDKNNDRINLAMINRFKRTIDDLQLLPLEMHGRRFTWCNDQQSPTMSKIDHLLATTEWIDLFPHSDLQAVASMGSNHCPLILQGDNQKDFYRGFRLESYWTKMPGFMEAVKEAWDNPVNTQDPLLRLHFKLLRTAKALKAWRRRNFSNWKLRTAIIQLILLELEKAQEIWNLSQEELEFKKFLKSRLVGLAVIQKCKTKQLSLLQQQKKNT
jgi:hypothetical protein